MQHSGNVSNREEVPHMHQVVSNKSICDLSLAVVDGTWSSYRDSKNSFWLCVSPIDLLTNESLMSRALILLCSNVISNDKLISLIFPDDALDAESRGFKNSNKINARLSYLNRRISRIQYLLLLQQQYLLGVHHINSNKGY